MQGQASLLEGRWEQGFELSKTAFEKSEIAFFDKNVLSLLYFPEENKYAVYIPLFVPVCLPVLVGFLKLFQRKKQNEIK